MKTDNLWGMFVTNHVSPSTEDWWETDGVGVFRCICVSETHGRTAATRGGLDPPGLRIRHGTVTADYQDVLYAPLCVHGRVEDRRNGLRAETLLTGECVIFNTAIKFSCRN